jgi:hypothetical protein
MSAVALMLVDMERSYITAGFFRHTMYTRFDKIKQQQAGMMASSNGTSGKDAPPTGMIGSTAAKAKNFFPAFGAKHDEHAPSPSAYEPKAPVQAKAAAAPGSKHVADGDESDGSADDTLPAKHSSSGGNIGQWNIVA